MGFKRFIEVGRVVFINYGEDYGKIAVIVDVLGANEVLIDGPTLGITRQLINVRKIALTEHVLKVPKGIRTGHL